MFISKNRIFNCVFLYLFLWIKNVYILYRVDHYVLWSGLGKDAQKTKFPIAKYPIT